MAGDSPDEPAWFAGHCAQDALDRLKVDATKGLDTREARRRRRRSGYNELRQKPPKTPARILIDQLHSLILLLLTSAALGALAFGHVTEAIAIGAVIVLNTAIGFFTELRAIRSMEALRTLSVVLTDKTGTLTDNKIQVTRLVGADGTAAAPDTIRPPMGDQPTTQVPQMLKVAALCNNASLGGTDGVGEPMEVALLQWVENPS